MAQTVSYRTGPANLPNASAAALSAFSYSLAALLNVDAYCDISLLNRSLAVSSTVSHSPHAAADWRPASAAALVASG